MRWNRGKGCQHVFRSDYYTEEALKIVFNN